MNYDQRIEHLREEKLRQTNEKLKKLGTRDEDDYGCVLPPDDFHWEPPVTRDDGSFFGAYAWGKNFRSLMENHPVYIDSCDALAGRWMFMLSRMRPGYRLELAPFPPEFDYSHLRNEQGKYDITCGIGKDAHFAPDYEIGLRLGWGGLLEKVRDCKSKLGDQDGLELLTAEEDAILGIQNWITRSAEHAGNMAAREPDPILRQNLLDMHEVNARLVEYPPQTFREACQWIAWFNMASRTHNRDGAGGQLDELLRPYYEKDINRGLIDDEDATFYLACLLLNDPHYYQIGGTGSNGEDVTSKLSFLILEAAKRLKVSCNLTISVHDGLDENLFRFGLQCLLEEKMGFPRFSGEKSLVKGFVRSGFSRDLARKRIAVGCNWMSLPGREYTLNDVIKINIAKVFEVAFEEMIGDVEDEPASLERLAELFSSHLGKAVLCTAKGIDFHLDRQFRNEPELLLNLLCYGPIEKARDASNGGLEYYNMCIDGAGLATVADSFAAIEQRVVREGRLDFSELADNLHKDFEGIEGRRIRQMLGGSEKFGQGDSLGDKWAGWLTDNFAETVKSANTPGGRRLMPGWFSWADTVRFGKSVGATPDGREANTPISHGANPNPGFRKDQALTAMCKAVAAVQPGYGSTAPWQLELDIGACDIADAADKIGGLIKTHLELGGTLININVVNAEQILQAHENPDLYPDLIVRVTGFTAYFSNLSKEFRQLVVDRIITR
ncbi:MAG: formate acetyltransferase [Phycisphaerae bacterium]|nr:formate acetyltransferase [Phycisphaerae bacterium]